MNATFSLPAARRRELVGRWALPALLLLVAAQVTIDSTSWLISGAHHLYTLRNLGRHPLPYIDQRIEYPVLTGVFMTAVAALTHSIHGFMRLNSIALGLCALGCTCTLWSISRRAAYRFALCPLLLVFSTVNWDLFALLLMLLGWRAYLRGHHAAAGAWLALGVFAKLFPVFLLGGCLLELIRRSRRGGRSERADLVRFAAAATVASLVVNLPFMIPAFHNWLWFWTFNAGRDGNADLLNWLGVLNAADVGTNNLVLTALVGLAILTGAAAIYRRRAPVAHTAALVFVAFMLMEKVYSPQYTLWVLGYALLAEWELWTIVALSLMGLVDYANAAIHIRLIADRSDTLRWYNHHIMGREQGLRLLVLLIIGGVMLVHRRLQSRSAAATPTGLDAAELGLAGPDGLYPDAVLARRAHRGAPASTANVSRHSASSSG